MKETQEEQPERFVAVVDIEDKPEEVGYFIEVETVGREETYSDGFKNTIWEELGIDLDDEDNDDRDNPITTIVQLMRGDMISDEILANLLVDELFRVQGDDPSWVPVPRSTARNAYALANQQVERMDLTSNVSGDDEVWETVPDVDIDTWRTTRDVIDAAMNGDING